MTLLNWQTIYWQRFSRFLTITRLSSRSWEKKLLSISKTEQRHLQMKKTRVKMKRMGTQAVVFRDAVVLLSEYVIQRRGLKRLLTYLQGSKLPHIYPSRLWRHWRKQNSQNKGQIRQPHRQARDRKSRRKKLSDRLWPAQIIYQICNRSRISGTSCFRTTHHLVITLAIHFYWVFLIHTWCEKAWFQLWPKCLATAKQKTASSCWLDRRFKIHLACFS